MVLHVGHAGQLPRGQREKAAAGVRVVRKVSGQKRKDDA